MAVYLLVLHITVHLLNFVIHLASIIWRPWPHGPGRLVRVNVDCAVFWLDVSSVSLWYRVSLFIIGALIINVLILVQISSHILVLEWVLQHYHQLLLLPFILREILPSHPFSLIGTLAIMGPRNLCLIKIFRFSASSHSGNIMIIAWFIILRYVFLGDSFVGFFLDVSLENLVQLIRI